MKIHKGYNLYLPPQFQELPLINTLSTNKHVYTVRTKYHTIKTILNQARAQVIDHLLGA